MSENELENESDDEAELEEESESEPELDLDLDLDLRERLDLLCLAMLAMGEQKKIWRLVGTWVAGKAHSSSHFFRYVHRCHTSQMFAIKC